MSSPLANNYQPSLSVNFNGMANAPTSGVSTAVQRVVSGVTSYSVDYNDSALLVDTLNGVLLTLPSLTGIADDGKFYQISNINTGLITITGSSSQTINRTVTATIATGVTLGRGLDVFGNKGLNMWFTY